ncbi:ABC transporter ATP-binding protein [Companilactobacillus alimentarius]|uniref:ABC transporter ATP-binding protein n=1 Tax=Companilactobacillus alimentarius TaxID=1602 RepID=UPI0028B5D7D9|nr:ABC transporter ATP-binding protein [Companilactobacillus alimentarius]MDT6951900.1 ABC transporter ATP-binding protein [Companilactobacillus alimentarius]
MITYKGVGMKYGQNTILNDINLTINDGELFVLVGPSGSGKTTLLRMLNQLTIPTSGDVYFSGKRIKDYDVQQLRLDTGYVLQDSSLFPNLSVEDNIAIQLEQKGVTRAKRRKRAAELLKSVDLDPVKYAKRMPDELSGGQQQRVAIIRALATEPSLVLMDESFSALDPVLRLKSQDLVLKLHKEFKTTIVFVTHDMQEALRMGQRIAVLNQGKIQQIGTPHDIMQNPANDFVKNFFGSKTPHWWSMDFLVGSEMLTQVNDKDLPQINKFSDLVDKLKQVPELKFQYQDKNYVITTTQLLEYFQKEGGNQ